MDTKEKHTDSLVPSKKEYFFCVFLVQNHIHRKLKTHTAKAIITDFTTVGSVGYRIKKIKPQQHSKKKIA